MSQNNYHTNPCGLYNVEWCWITSVKYGPKDVLLFHCIYSGDGCALSQRPGIAVPSTVVPHNRKVNFASWLLLQPEGSLGHQGKAHGRSMRNRRTVQLLTLRLPAWNSINSGCTLRGGCSMPGTEFLLYNTLWQGWEPSRRSAKMVLGATGKDQLSARLVSCSVVTNN